MFHNIICVFEALVFIQNDRIQNFSMWVLFLIVVYLHDFCIKLTIIISRDVILKLQIFIDKFEICIITEYAKIQSSSIQLFIWNAYIPVGPLWSEAWTKLVSYVKMSTPGRGNCISTKSSKQFYS